MAKTTFNDGNKSLGILGTRVLAAWLNKVFNHRHTGLDDDGHSILDYATTTGSANAYVLTLSPALESYVQGMPILFKANFANTGAATLNINSLGAIPLKTAGQDLIPGQISTGLIVTAAYDGTNFQILSLPTIVRNAELNMTGEFWSESSFDYLDINIGAVSAGDVIWVEFYVESTLGGANVAKLMSITCSGTATRTFLHKAGKNTIQQRYMTSSGGTGEGHIVTTIQVTGDGSLTISCLSDASESHIYGYGFFLRKK